MCGGFLLYFRDDIPIIVAHMENRTKGFTLIELLLVIAVIGLIGALAMAMIDTARRKPRDAKRVSDIKAIQTALDLYMASSSTGYPATPVVALGEPGADRLCDTGWQSRASACAGKVYLELVPKAPPVADGACTPAENAYTYQQTGTGTGYIIDFCLGGEVSGYPAGPVTATEDGIL